MKKRRKYVTLLTVLLIIIVIVIRLKNINLVDEIPAKCILYENYGLYCTGCGGTRACMALLHGHVLKSIIYHPAIIYMVMLFLYQIYQYVVSLRKNIKFKIHPIGFYILIGIIIGQCLVKNIVLIVFNYRII